MQAQPAAVYDHRARSLGRIQAKREKLTERLANARLAVFILGLLAALYLHRFSTPLVGLSTGILTLLLYAFLVFRHRKLLAHLRYVITLRGINERGAARTAGRWTEFSDTGSDFRDDDHPYASDLDLFGRGSLFRWINSTSTPLGREGLARLLKEPLAERTEILARQEAVTELARKLAWRQRFEAEGLLVPGRDQTTEPLLQWAGRSSEAYLHPATHLGVRALPAATIFSLALWAFLPALS